MNAREVLKRLQETPEELDNKPDPLHVDEDKDSCPSACIISEKNPCVTVVPS